MNNSFCLSEAKVDVTQGNYSAAKALREEVWVDGGSNATKSVT